MLLAPPDPTAKPGVPGVTPGFDGPVGFWGFNGKALSLEPVVGWGCTQSWLVLTVGVDRPGRESLTGAP